jgi:hypothetical protein
MRRCRTMTPSTVHSSLVSGRSLPVATPSDTVHTVYGTMYEVAYRDSFGVDTPLPVRYTECVCQLYVVAHVRTAAAAYSSYASSASLAEGLDKFQFTAHPQLHGQVT